MGITGLIPFLEKASRRVNVNEFSGCTVAIDSYCWLHKGAFACADKLVRGEETDIYVKYCLKYVTMLLSKNIKPILVFDGRHLPAKALTEAKRRESRDISKKRAAELLSLGKIDEARSYMRRSVDITHAMALALIKECRNRNVDCIVAPYEADAQLAYLNIKNIAQLVITEDSDLILFGCTKVLFKMDLDGVGTLVETIKLPLTMKCPIENYSFDKFRQMCIMSGCDYLPSLPGIGLAKARQFVTATRDSNFANALRKLPSYFNRSSLIVTDEYRENFVKAEATFKHQYVYDPIERKMVRLTEPDDEDVEQALCVNAGQLLDCKVAFQLALGNLDPFTLKKMDDWHPDHNNKREALKTDSWIDKSSHPSIWSGDFEQHLKEQYPWRKKVEKREPILMHVQSRATKKVVNLVSKYVPETQDDSLTIESLSSMYCVVEPTAKKQKIDNTTEIAQTFTQNDQNDPNKDEMVKDIIKRKEKSPILTNKGRSFKKCIKNGYSSIILQTLSKFPRTTLDDNIVESKFFNTTSIENNHLATINDINEDCTEEDSKRRVIIEESLDKCSRNPFKIKSPENMNKVLEIDTECSEIINMQLENSQKENNNLVKNGQFSPILESSPKQKNLFKLKLDDCVPTFDNTLSQDTVIENTYPLENLVTPVDTQLSFGESPPKTAALINQRNFIQSQSLSNSPPVKEIKKNQNASKRSCKVPGLKRTASLPSNQPTLLSRFGFEKKPVLKR